MEQDALFPLRGQSPRETYTEGTRYKFFVEKVDKLKFNAQERIKLYQELLNKKMDEYFG